MNWLSMILITFFCMSSSLQAADMNTSDRVIKKILLDMNSSGKRVDLKVGSEFQIELQGIGSTGYSWYFDQLDLDFFELIDEERKEIRKDQNVLTGGPFQYIWKLKPRRSGTSTIRMDYYRIWEGKEKAVQRFEVRVDIHL